MAKAIGRTVGKKKTLASLADKLMLYELSVQETEPDIRLIRRVFSKNRGRVPLAFREDFCGTAKMCADWVREGPMHTAVGIDLCQKTLDWSQRNHIDRLNPCAKKRVKLFCRNVLDGSGESFDVIAAFNFSYWVFKTRESLKQYFSAAQKELNDQGLLILDIHGGPESQRELTEQKKCDGFTYLWEQKPVDAITHECERVIHFKMKDKSEIRRAFVYDWRLWTIPEVTDILRELGFARVDVLWEGADGKGGGNGIFTQRAHVENEDAWIAYLCAWK